MFHGSFYIGTCILYITRSIRSMVNEHGGVGRGAQGDQRGWVEGGLERCFSRGLLNTAGLIGKTALYRTTTSSHWPRESISGLMLVVC